jgi:hypothetical protein
MIPQNPASVFALPTSVIAAAKMLGKSDHRDVFSASFTDAAGEHYAFFNKDADGSVTAFIVANELHIFGRDVVEIVRSWTRDDLQKRDMYQHY